MEGEFYERGGVRYARITSILDFFQPPELVSWRMRVGNREANRISKQAINIGTNVDEAIRAEVEGRKVPKLKTVEAQNCWEAWLQWANDYKADVHTVETVFNDELLVAGTPDLVMAKKCVVDVKCSSAIRESYWLQTEFYGRNFFGVTHKAVLRLDKNLRIYEYKEMPLCDEHWEAVKGAIKLYRYYNKSVTDGEGEQDERNTDITDNEK